MKKILMNIILINNLYCSTIEEKILKEFNISNEYVETRETDYSYLNNQLEKLQKRKKVDYEEKKSIEIDNKENKSIEIDNKENKSIEIDNKENKSIEIDNKEYKSIEINNKENKVIKIDYKENKLLEYKNMEIGSWEIDKEKILNDLDKEKKIYLITPIIDKKEYKNDKFYLKQMGLSYKRAETATLIIKLKNKENIVYINNKIEIRENERGFILTELK